MPVKVSQFEETEQAKSRNQEQLQESATVSPEEIETPVEAIALEQAEREFETKREIPENCTKAIVSVNGQDVKELPIQSHGRAA